MIVSSISYKGGVGKSTIAQNLAVQFARTEHKVVVIDSDESGASSKWAAARAENGIEPFIQVVQKLDPRDLIPSVERLYADNDVVIIDGPPSLFPIVSKIILVSHIILVPVAPKGGGDMWVTEDFLKRYEEVRQTSEKAGQAFFVLNMFKDNLNLHKAVAEALDEHNQEYGVRKLDSLMRDRVAYGEANTQGMSVVEYSDTKARSEILALYEEVKAIYEKI